MTDYTTSRIRASACHLHAYSRSHSFEDLRSAVIEMVGAGDNRDLTKPEDFIEQRRVLVRGWAAVLAVVEQAYDPTYDPNDQSQWPILGLNPQMIQDPDQRAAEWALVAANDEKVKRASYYHDLRIIDGLAQSSLKAQLAFFRRRAPKGTDADFATLDGIVKDAGLSDALRAKIDLLFSPPPPRSDGYTAEGS
ncbi:MAG TPA: hypothetical protein VGN14_09545 [Candidatus Elarobacter sp.]